MREIIDKIDDKIQILITLFIVFFLCTTSATYAYFALTNSSVKKDNTIDMMVSVSNVIFTEDEKKSEGLTGIKINNGDIDGLLSTTLKNKCLDNKKNVVCHVYKISINNISSSITQVIDGSISFFADSKLETNIKNKTANLKWRLIENFDELDILKSNLGTNKDNFATSNKDFFIKDTLLQKDTSADYYLLVWLDGKDMKEISIDSYFMKLQIESSNGTNITSILKG